MSIAVRGIVLGALYLLVAGVLACLYALGITLPLQAAVLAFTGATILALVFMPGAGLVLLPRFMLVLYAAPFSSLVGYLLVRNFTWWTAPTAADLVLQDALMVEMLSVGTVGLFALAGGMALGVGRYRRVDDGVASVRRGLHWFAFTGMLSGALAIAALVALTQTRGEAGYHTDALEAATSGGSFGTLYVVAYMLLAMLFVDGQREPDARSRRRKLAAVLGVSAFILVFFQLRTGDREIAGLLVALAALHVTYGTWKAGRERADVTRVVRLAPAAALVLVAFLAVGQLRFADRRADAGGFLDAATTELAAGGTWTAVLLGNLGLAAESRDRQFRYLHGETYVDYALSLPPGFVTRALGVERSMEAADGPGLWYYPLQFGGVHPVLVPYKNFGIAGVTAVLALVGLLIGMVERLGRTPGFIARCYYAAFFVSSFNWFWYGDMPMIRGLMAATVLMAAFIILEQLRLWPGRGHTAVAPAGSA